MDTIPDADRLLGVAAARRTIGKKRDELREINFGPILDAMTDVELIAFLESRGPAGKVAADILRRNRRRSRLVRLYALQCLDQSGGETSPTAPRTA